MRLEFINHETVQRAIQRELLVKPSDKPPRVIALDSPAGMGKSRLLLEVCHHVIASAHERGEEWRIVWLDFRKCFPGALSSKKEIIEEIARQLCRDIQLSTMLDAIHEGDSESWLLIQQAAQIPMENEDRRALLNMIPYLPADILEKINGFIAEAFEQVDIQDAKKRGELRSVLNLIDFILTQRLQTVSCPIPGHIFIVLDGVDAIDDKELRHWVVNKLAYELGTHSGLQNVLDRFAVVISGRFLEQDIDLGNKGNHFLIVPLQSFASQLINVVSLVRQFDDKALNARNDMLNRLARKLCQVCGGHPRVIKDTAIQLYERAGGCFIALEMNPTGALYWYTQYRATITKRREAAIEEILEDVDQQEQCLLQLLSVFRKFNLATLEFLHNKIRVHKMHNYYDCFEGDVRGLYQRLRGTRLVGNDEAEGPFDTDRFSLNLLSIQMQEQDRDTFKLLNQWAVELFEDWIKGKFSDKPDAALKPEKPYQRVGVREWLFHRLHLARPSHTVEDASLCGKQIREELAEVLKHIEPYPYESRIKQQQRIKGDIEKDEEIDHLIWEIALEDQTRHDIIWTEIFKAFLRQVCEWLIDRLRQAEPCSTLEEARTYGEEIAEELGEILEDMVPCPHESPAEQRQRIKRDVENDERIDDSIWDIVLEDTDRHDMIRKKIFEVFQEEGEPDDC